MWFLYHLKSSSVSKLRKPVQYFRWFMESYWIYAFILLLFRGWGFNTIILLLLELYCWMPITVSYLPWNIFWIFSDSASGQIEKCQIGVITVTFSDGINPGVLACQILKSLVSSLATISTMKTSLLHVLVLLLLAILCVSAPSATVTIGNDFYFTGKDILLHRIN